MNASRAVAVGFLVPEPPWTGRIAGLPSRAVTILAPDGALVSLVADAGDMECRAVLVDAPALAALRRLPAPEGDEARTLGTLLLARGFELDLEAVPRWDPRGRLAAAAAALSGQPPTGALEVLAAVLAEADTEGTIRGEGAFGSAFAALRESAGFPANLVGFGPGSTPAGDDYLAGWVLACVLLGAEPPGKAEPARTSPAGRALLLQALAGGFPASHVALAEALARAAAGEGEQGRTVAEAGRDLLRHGASSGADTLQGFLEGIGRILAEKGKTRYRWYP